MAVATAPLMSPAVGAALLPAKVCPRFASVVMVFLLHVFPASCMAYHINNPDYQHSYWSALRFKPACNNDGSWQAKQCKGGVNGR